MVLRGHEEYIEMLAAHALGALETAEARELDAHLTECAECRAQLDSWRGTAAALAYAAPTVEPSAGTRSRILASVRAESMQSTSRVADSRAGQSSRVESNVVPFATPSRRAWSTASRFGAMAASVAFIALVVSLILLWNRYNTVRQETAQLSERLNQTQGELARALETLAREREAIELVAAPDARVSTLAGTEMASSAHAKFVLDRNTGRAMLMAYNLPPAPEGKAYQLWYLAEGKPAMPGHVFTPDASGHVEMHDQVPVEGRNAKAFAVTLEQSAGATTPTEPIYMLSAAS